MESGKTIKDFDYYNELCNEIEIKEQKALWLMQEVQFLRTILMSVENGYTREQIKKRLEYNPFEDFDFFGVRGCKNEKK